MGGISLSMCRSKINQFNMVMYGYWPFEFDEYPETIYKIYRLKYGMQKMNDLLR